MDDRRFEAELAGLGEGLRSRRGSCPSPERLGDHARGLLSGADSELVREHVRLCAACQGLVDAALASPAEVDDAVWGEVSRRLDARPAPWRRAPRRARVGWLAAAASVVLVVGLSFWMASGPGPTVPVSATRGGALQPISPVGSVRRLEAFRWQAPPLALSYRVEVRLGDALVWSGTASDTTVEASPELRRLLSAGVTYRWRVEGVDEAGRAVVASDWVELRWVPEGN